MLINHRGLPTCLHQKHQRHETYQKAQQQYQKASFRYIKKHGSDLKSLKFVIKHDSVFLDAAILKRIILYSVHHRGLAPFIIKTHGSDLKSLKYVIKHDSKKYTCYLFITEALPRLSSKRTAAIKKASNMS
jgi:hypothetical protein